MADIRISQLTSLSTAADSDLIIINDTSAATTKSITKENLFSGVPKNVVDSASGAKVTGDLSIDNELRVGGDATLTNIIFTGSINDTIGGINVPGFTGVIASPTNELPTTTAVIDYVTNTVDVGGIALSVLRTVSTDASGTFFPTFVGTENIADSVNTDTDFTYDPNTNTLTVANLAGNASSATTAGSATTATSATTASTATTATNANNVLVDASPNTDATMYPALFGLLSSTNQPVELDSSLSYNASTGTLSATAFVGDGSGLTGIAGGGGSSNALNTVSIDTAGTYYPTFVGTENTTDSVNTDTDLTYNPNTNTLTAGAFVGDGSGLTGIAGGGGSATTLNTVSTSASGSFRPLFVGTENSVDSVNTNSNFSYNPDTNTLSCTNFAGTASFATVVDIQAENSSATQHPVTFALGSGYTASKIDVSEFTYQPSTGTVTATAFVGDGSGLTGIAAGGGSSNALNTASIDTDATYYPTFVGTENTVDSVNTDTNLTYNPSTNTLTAGAFVGDGSGLTGIAGGGGSSDVLRTESIDTAGTYYPTFVGTENSVDSVNTDTQLTYNPSTNTLSLAADGAILALGQSSDFELEHDGTKNVIRTDAFQLFVMNATDSARAMFDNNGDLHAEGDLIAFSTTIVSDPRFKENIESIDSPLEKLSEINGVTWNWKRNGERGAGVISTDVKKVLPEAVKTRNTLNTKTEYEAVNYDAIIGLLVESVKELKKEIEELKAK